MNLPFRLFSTGLFFALLNVCFADVKLPPIISDHMVLKKSAKVPIWGTADPGEKVSVSLNGQTVSTHATPDGKWIVAFNLAKSGPGPFKLVIQGKNKITVSDVVVGEVWIASGQSNMEWFLKDTINASATIAASSNPMLRQFSYAKNARPAPADDFEGKWGVAGPEDSANFSAVGYYFGKTLQKELSVPVGIISTTWGGSPLEAWTRAEVIDAMPNVQSKRQKATEEILTYPARRTTYVESFGKWLRETGREDRPVADAVVAAFAGKDIPADGWTTVKLPGAIADSGLAANGVIWLRRDIEIPTENTSKPLRFNLGRTARFDTVYLNGKPFQSFTYESYPGVGFSKIVTIPPGQFVAGKNTVAIRVYAPVDPVQFDPSPKLGRTALDGQWLAKTEYELPPLDAAQLAAAPQPPKNPPDAQNVPGFLYNGMIHPMLSYAITGAIWYQGESNVARAVAYRKAFPLMITDWRQRFGQGDFPFYFCQLANFTPKINSPGDSSWAELREAQSMTLKLPNTGQAVLIDVGESDDIHPRNKKDPGERLARIALAQTYGRKIPYSGPVYSEMQIDDGKIRLKFDHTAGGLVARALPATYFLASADNKTAPLIRNTPESQVEGFAICGDDGKWVWADAKISGDSVIVWSSQVPTPVAVRYGWANNPTCNLYNGAGLPASPFRTDDFPEITAKGEF